MSPILGSATECDVPMSLLAILIIFVGAALQVVAYRFYHRGSPEVWGSPRPVWRILHPRGVALMIAGVFIVIAGLALYVRAS